MKSIVIILFILVASGVFAANPTLYPDTGSNVQTQSTTTTVIPDNYAQLVSSRIHAKFRIPQGLDKDLTATIDIKISKTGEVTR
jgi:hypothetical protein